VTRTLWDELNGVIDGYLASVGLARLVVRQEVRNANVQPLKSPPRLEPRERYDPFDKGLSSIISTMLETLVNRPYRHGFVTEIEADVVAKGLSEDVVRLNSAKKGEHVQQGQGSGFASGSFALGAVLSGNDITTRLDAEGFATTRPSTPTQVTSRRVVRSAIGRDWSVDLGRDPRQMCGSNPQFVDVAPEVALPRLAPGRPDIDRAHLSQ
jgi:hypothetical protein